MIETIIYTCISIMILCLVCIYIALSKSNKGKKAFFMSISIAQFAMVFYMALGSIIMILLITITAKWIF